MKAKDVEKIKIYLFQNNIPARKPPIVSAAKSPTEASRPGTNIWCISSNPPYAATINVDSSTSLKGRPTTRRVLNDRTKKRPSIPKTRTWASLSSPQKREIPDKSCLEDNKKIITIQPTDRAL